LYVLLHAPCIHIAVALVLILRGFFFFSKCKYTSYIVLHSLYLHCCLDSEIYILHFTTLPVFEVLYWLCEGKRKKVCIVHFTTPPVFALLSVLALYYNPCIRRVVLVVRGKKNISYILLHPLYSQKERQYISYILLHPLYSKDSTYRTFYYTPCIRRECSKMYDSTCRTFCYTPCIRTVVGTRTLVLILRGKDVSTYRSFYYTPGTRTVVLILRAKM